MKNFFLKHFKNYNQSLSDTINEIDSNLIYDAANLIESTIKKKKFIYVCGNGGSFAIANHYICDYMKNLGEQTNLKVKIKSLCSDNELISAISNDISYDDIFVFQGKKCLEKGDLLILISSSGNSKNLKKILKYANSIKVKSIGFCGFNGGYLKNNCSVVIHSKINNYGISEDINHILMHLIMHYIKLKNLKKNVNNKKIIL
jgi:D-sedoheptulose 7-phosphate isomerase